MEQLKKCPFCGCEAELVGNRFFRVMCTECNAHIEDFETAIEAVIAWNTRKPMERIAERLENNSFWTEPTYDIDGYSNEDEIEVINLQKAIEIMEEEMQ